MPEGRAVAAMSEEEDADYRLIKRLQSPLGATERRASKNPNAAPGVFVLTPDRADEICLQRREAVRRLTLLRTEADAMLITLEQITALRRSHHVAGFCSVSAPQPLLELAEQIVRNSKHRRQRV
jgi:hypothetical protein